MTDLHSCRYGSGQKDIFRKLEEIDKEKPIAALLLAGDMRTGQSLVVRALADGRAAALEINSWLRKD